MSPALAELEQVADRLVPVAEIRHFTDLLYDIDISQMRDGDFEVIERLIDRAVRLLSEPADSGHRDVIQRLLIAREGIEQGISPDPAKRPTVEEMRRFVATRL